MKRFGDARGWFAGLLAPALACILAASAQAAGPSGRLTIATLSVGTVFDVVASGLGKVATEHTPMTVAVAPMASARSWVHQANDTGRPELGIMQMSEIWQAYTGKLAPKPEQIPGDPRKGPPYRPASPHLRILLAGTTLRAAMLVRDDSPIKTMEEMKGKRMTWGFPAFPPNIEWGLGLLAAGGMTVNEIVPVPVTEVTTGIQALVDRRLDVAIAAVGMPAVSEANARIGVRFLPVPKNPGAIKQLQQIMPGSTIQTLPAGLPGIKVPTSVGVVPIVVQTTTALPDDVAYALVKVWWDHYKELEPIHPQFRGWNPKGYVTKLATVPYHPGAIKFYKEMGVWTAEDDAMQARLLKGEYVPAGE